MYHGKQNYVKSDILSWSRCNRRDCNRSKSSQVSKKLLVCSRPDLIKFNVTSKVTDILDKEGLAYEIYSDIKANPTIENVQHGVQAFKNSGADYIMQSAADLLWILPKQSVSSSQTRNLKM